LTPFPTSLGVFERALRRWIDDPLPGDYFGWTLIPPDEMQPFREFLFTALADPGAPADLRALEGKLQLTD
jgi:hypothetical protein